MPSQGQKRENHKEYLTKLHQQGEEYDLKESGASVKQAELEKTGGELQAELESQKELLRDEAEFVRSMEEELSDHEDLLEGKRREIFRIWKNSVISGTTRAGSSHPWKLTHREEASARTLKA